MITCKKKAKISDYELVKKFMERKKITRNWSNAQMQLYAKIYKATPESVKKLIKERIMKRKLSSVDKKRMEDKKVYTNKVKISAAELGKKFMEKRMMKGRLSEKSKEDEYKKYWERKIRHNRKVANKGLKFKVKKKKIIKPILKEENVVLRKREVKVQPKKLQLKFDYRIMLWKKQRSLRKLNEVQSLSYKKVNYESLLKKLKDFKRYKGEIHDRDRSPIAILSNMLMKHGKSRMIECKMNRILRGLRRKLGLKMKFSNFFEKVNSNVCVKIGLFKRRISGIMRSIPVLLPAYKVKREAWKRIVNSANSRSERTMEVRIMKELIDAFLKKGRSVKARNERYKEIKKHKVWLKHIRY